VTVQYAIELWLNHCRRALVVVVVVVDFTETRTSDAVADNEGLQQNRAAEKRHDPTNRPSYVRLGRYASQGGYRRIIFQTNLT